MSRQLLACLAALLAFFPPAVLGQSDPAAKPLAWDVISVKPNHSLDPSSFMRWNLNGIEFRNTTLHGTLLNAFEVRSESQITGYPGWVNSEHFDIEAKMDADTAAAYRALRGEASKQQWHAFMQQILDERFGMKFHVEKRELPVYNLVVAKQGVKLKISAPEETGSSSMGPGKYSARRGHAGGLAFSLSGVVGRVIFDRTGLTGDYDIDLTWAPDDKPDAGPSIFSALQEQLGLKLEPAKAPVDVIVIDHLERPSEN
ncbi:TIGR03435 family protein [Occallatibacter savannae]|uniref:TIGR03435 family protein n=1 Tax=Occallatibacter savannae TaxID=1002691 RepID=UPI000D69B911|nr:TIGR03435 family protein [Occallatibacter savannae]